MTQDQIQVELEKHKSIIDAALDYLLLHDTGKIVFDDIDRDKRHYESQQAKAEKYFKNSNIDKLEKQFRDLRGMLQHKVKPTLDFRSYLKERTGYDIDIFAEHRENFEKVLAKGRIDSEKECQDFCILISQQAIDEKQLEDSYGPMLEAFYQMQMKKIEESPELKKKYDKHHETVEKDGELVEIFWSHGKPTHENRRVELSPNGKYSLSITEIGFEDYSSTQIDLNLENYGCGLFSVEGVHPEINAFWRDNQTIVIETKGHESLTKHRKIEIYGKKITIEYIND